MGPNVLIVMDKAIGKSLSKSPYPVEYIIPDTQTIT